MRIALLPGSFNPPTLGHLDLIQRAAKACDRLLVGVAINRNKGSKQLFTTEETIFSLKEITKELPSVEIVTFSSLVVEFAKKVEASFLIRGIRSMSDIDYELSMAHTNRTLSGIETLFLFADPRYAHIRSSLIRELGTYQRRLHEFVPAPLEERIFTRLAASSKIAP